MTCQPLILCSLLFLFSFILVSFGLTIGTLFVYSNMCFQWLASRISILTIAMMFFIPMIRVQLFTSNSTSDDCNICTIYSDGNDRRVISVVSNDTKNANAIGTVIPHITHFPNDSYITSYETVLPRMPTEKGGFYVIDSTYVIDNHTL